LNLVNNIMINTYSIIILIIIYYHSVNHSDNDYFQHKLFTWIINATIIMLAIDIFSRFDGNSNTINSILNHFGNFTIFMLNLILPSFWLLYVHYQIFHEEEKTKKLFYPILIINLINLVVLILSQFFGWYYYIDSNNIYHRGPLFFFPVIVMTIFLIFIYIFIILNRKKIVKRNFYTLLFFTVPPFICLLLQAKFYGISLMLNGVVLSILVVFLNIQNHSIYTDFLTGVNNRNKLEIYLKEKVKLSTKTKTFSAIMIDLNDFKSINDTYGHDIGDEALQISVKLLKSCIRTKDFIARYGGDEFCIVLETCDINDLEVIISRMKSSFAKYNKYNNKPYKISFSCGYAVYDNNYHSNVEEFKIQIDKLMYKNKQAK